MSFYASNLICQCVAPKLAPKLAKSQTCRKSKSVKSESLHVGETHNLPRVFFQGSKRILSRGQEYSIKCNIASDDRHTTWHDTGMLEESSSQEAAGDMESEEEQSEEEATSSQVAALQEQMVFAMQRVSAAEKEAAAAKEAAGTELALMRRQLTSSQAALAEAEQVHVHPWQEFVGLCPLMHK